MTAMLQTRLTVAADSTRSVCRLLGERKNSNRPAILKLLRDAERAIESHAWFTPEEMCYFRNRLNSCRRLVAACEWGAARYEMTELSRKLMRADS